MVTESKNKVPAGFASPIPLRLARKGNIHLWMLGERALMGEILYISHVRVVLTRRP